MNYYLTRLDPKTLSPIESLLVQVYKHQLDTELLLAGFVQVKYSNVYENVISGELISVIKAVPSRSGIA